MPKDTSKTYSSSTDSEMNLTKLAVGKTPKTIQQRLSFTSKLKASAKSSEQDLPQELLGAVAVQLDALEKDTMGGSWYKALRKEFEKPYFIQLKEFLANELKSSTVYPPLKDVYSWSRLTPLESVKVVVLGQDPYHNVGQAHGCLTLSRHGPFANRPTGLSFSVLPPTALPGSLKNIYKQMAEDVPGFKFPNTGDLTPLARSGVLWLNTSLTVRPHKAGSHAGKGWETLTAQAIKAVTSRLEDNGSENKGVVFMAWGLPAQKTIQKIGVDEKKHLVLRSAHPSPLSAYRGFLGNGHFKRANEWLREKYGEGAEINWKAICQLVVTANVSMTRKWSSARLQYGFEQEDAECPLCLEEMDIADLNFKPCVCGYQICRFCWHHIKENLNKRCPACRRLYTDETVEFKPIAAQDHKRLTQQKKQRERERKDLDTLGRRNLANVRVVQRNVVYVVGIGPRFAKEEVIPTLRSSEYFGQYGKINKIILVKRNSSGGGAPVLGVYITFQRREDAARAIAAVDGSPSPGGGRDVMRASHGTTKYCMAFLRSVACNDHSCMNLHEWGDEKDCFTKEDLTTLKHTMKTTETRARSVLASKEADGLPRSAAWGSRANALPAAPPTASIQRKRGGAMARPSRPQTETRPSARTQEKKSAKLVPETSSSRPATPASTLPLAHPSLPPKPPSPVTRRKKEEPPARIPSPASAPSVTGDDSESSSQEVASTSPEPRPQSTDSSSALTAPPGLSAVPPGLAAPPGLSAPPGLAGLNNPHMSTAARALLDDVTARRESLLPSAFAQSPFPDFDRTLENLSQHDGGFGGFSFNLDMKLAGDEAANDEPLTELEPESNIPFFGGSFLDAFPALRSATSTPSISFATPPGLPYPHSPAHAIFDPINRSLTPSESQSSTRSNYMGSFNPFADGADETLTANTAPAKPPPVDDDVVPRLSRFGFARQGPRNATAATSSPLQVSSTPSVASNTESNPNHNNNVPLNVFGQQIDHAVPHSPAISQWSIPGRQQEFSYSQANSAVPSPMMTHAQAQPMYHHPPQSRFQPFDTAAGVSEAQLRDFIQNSQERPNILHHDSQGLYKTSHHQHFQDPAIMSASRFTVPEANYMHAVDMSYGPPPGLSFPPGLQNNINIASTPLGEGCLCTELAVLYICAFERAPSPPPNSVNHSRLSDADNYSPFCKNHTLPHLVFYSLNYTEPQAEPVPEPEPESERPSLSSPSDFPALSSTFALSENTSQDASSPSTTAPSEQDLKVQEKAERKAAKQAAAAAKAAERQKIAQEKAAAKAAEKTRIAAEKAAEKALKAQLEKEKAEKEKLEKEKERLLQVERERAAQAEREKAAQLEKEKAAKKAAAKASENQKAASRRADAKPSSTKEATPSALEELVQVPLLSKKPKKNKPASKPVRIPQREDDHSAAENNTDPSTATSDIVLDPTASKGTSSNNSSNNSRSTSLERHTPTSLEELLEDIHVMNPSMNLLKHPLFDLHKINPAAKMPLEYGPLVHALSALSVGGGSFANNVPSGSIDNAVSSFQQLLETLTQTISDLLRLLPRTTWDDSSSFDGVLRDMLKGDDFLDEGGATATTAASSASGAGNIGESAPQGREDEVAALTLALERRARWMEVQLSKLEELHRDINNAAVRAVLAFNDSGWDRHGFLPRVGHTVRRFESIGIVEDEAGHARPMTSDELEKKMAVAKEAAVFAETELREMMEKMQHLKPYEDDF
ncbi:hypothetical protein D9757_007216 [Collybiopsis confluens]|uniref:Uracil-DNA glycosylase n=1 Tax=Collybiopsis confluens TaxID=2823264 RepID=A0A8H5M3Z4_9AGAR|nr:hypothetical protein D9757_007216 [Collybiopsis confluens]